MNEAGANPCFLHADWGLIYIYIMQQILFELWLDEYLVIGTHSLLFGIMQLAFENEFNISETI